jgi:AcrR family transcriptional regulator
MRGASKSQPRYGPATGGGVVAAEPSFGRPRDERIDTEVVAAVLDVLRRRGYGAVTIDGIARKVKRARTSLYRRWPSKRNLVAYSVLSELGEHPVADTGSLREDLEAALGTLLHAFAGPLGQAFAGLVADMARDIELADIIRQQLHAAGREFMREAFARATARREIRDDLQIELLLDMLTGPCYFRALFRQLPISRRRLSDIVEYALRVAAL